MVFAPPRDRADALGAPLPPLWGKGGMGGEAARDRAVPDPVRGFSRVRTDGDVIDQLIQAVPIAGASDVPKHHGLVGKVHDVLPKPAYRGLVA